MRIVVPYAALHPIVVEVLAEYALNVEYVSVAKDDDAYRRLLRQLWLNLEPVILVEHDIVPWPGAIEELAACSCSWGSYTYKLDGGYGIFHGFGCTKLTPQLMQAVPDVWHEPCRWNELDQRLLFAARDNGFEPHHHRPPVVHLKGAS